jgi:hypothetical protein
MASAHRQQLSLRANFKPVRDPACYRIYLKGAQWGFLGCSPRPRCAHEGAAFPRKRRLSFERQEQKPRPHAARG